MVGAIDTFDPQTENWLSYSERLEQFFVANDIGQTAEGADAAALQVANTKKVATMIAVIGKTAYSILRDLCSPDAPSTKTFNALCDLLKNHYKPKALEVAESYKFHHAVQEENETVANYYARLKRLATFCNFGTHLQRALRDQLINGIRSADTRKKLLATDRELQQVFDVAIAEEAAKRESQLLDNADANKSVNFMKGK